MHIVCLFPLPLRRVGIWRNLVSLALPFPAALDYRSTHKPASYLSHVDRMEVSQFVLECQMNWSKGNETAQLVGPDTHCQSWWPDSPDPHNRRGLTDSCELFSDFYSQAIMHMHACAHEIHKMSEIFKKLKIFMMFFFLKIIYPETRHKGLKGDKYSWKDAACPVTKNIHIDLLQEYWTSVFYV